MRLHIAPALLIALAVLSPQSSQAGFLGVDKAQAGIYNTPVERVAKRGQEIIVAQYNVYFGFCQPAYVGRIGVSPNPKLGSLRFEEGQNSNTTVCNGKSIPFTRVLYRAGAQAGDDVFSIFVFDGSALEQVKVIIHVR
jgi:hypothetical protein